MRFSAVWSKENAEYANLMVSRYLIQAFQIEKASKYLKLLNNFKFKNLIVSGFLDGLVLRRFRTYD